MKIEGLHEKELFGKKFPFRLILNQDLNFNYPPHWHNAIELIYVLKNDFVVIVNSKKYNLKEKDIFFIPSGDIHEFQSETQTGTRIFINFELSSLNFYNNADRIRTLLCDVRQITPQDGDLYNRIQEELQKMLENKIDENIQELYYTARAIDILILLCQSLPSKINLESMENVRGKNWGLNKINKSFDYIEKNYTEDIHLKDLAQAVGFSEYYFSRLFKEITEKNFHQYLNEYRIKKAEILLADSSYSVSEAAYATGFISIATFDRLFRKIKGCSPQEFRKLHVNH